MFGSYASSDATAGLEMEVRAIFGGRGPGQRSRGSRRRQLVKEAIVELIAVSYSQIKQTSSEQNEQAKQESKKDRKKEMNE